MLIRLPDRVVDLAARRVRQGDRDVPLTDREVALLGFLAARPGEAVARDVLLAEVWDLRAAVVTRCVDTAVKRLRRKIEADPAEPRHLLKVHGHGYRFDPAPPRPAPGPVPASRTDLPAPPALVGRDALVEHVAGLLAEGAARVTLVGPPGVGAEAVALVAAHRAGGAFPGGVWRAPPGAPAGDRLLVDGRALHTGGAGPEAVVVVPALDPASAGALLRAEAARSGVVAPIGGAELDAVVHAARGLPSRLRRAAAQLAVLDAGAVAAALRGGVGEEERAVAARTLDGLAPADRAALHALCTFQTPFTPGDAGEVAGEADGASLIVRLVRAGALMASPGAAGRFEVPPALHAAAGPPPDDAVAAHLRWCTAWAWARSRAHRHGGATDGLEEIGGRLAEVHAALVGADGPDAARLAEAVDPFAFARLEAREHLALLDQVEAKLGPDDGPAWISVLQMRGEALRRTGQLARARGALDEALARADRAPDLPARDRAMVLGCLALLEHTEAAWDAALARYAEAIATIGAPDELSVAWALHAGGIHRMLGRTDAAEASARAALHQAQGLGLPAAVARCEEALGVTLCARGQHVEGARRLAAAVEAHRRHGHQRHLVHALWAAAVADLDRGRFAEAEAAADEGLALARRLSMAVLDANHLSVAGQARLFVGDAPGAVRRLEDSVVAHRDVPGRAGAWYPLLWLAAAHAVGDERLAHEGLAEARAELVRLGDPVGLRATLVELVAAVVALGAAPTDPDRRTRAAATLAAHADHPHQHGSIDHRLARRLLEVRLRVRRATAPA